MAENLLHQENIKESVNKNYEQLADSVIIPVSDGTADVVDVVYVNM